jgi:hypothetical protein
MKLILRHIQFARRESAGLDHNFDLAPIQMAQAGAATRLPLQALQTKILCASSSCS